MATTLRNADGSWAAPFVVSGSSSGPSTARALGCHAVRRRATPRRASRSSTRLVAHAPGASDQNLQPQLGGCCGYVPQDGARQRRPSLDRLVLERDGSHRRCTCSSSIPVTARADRRARAGAQQRELATTTASAPNLACAATCRLVYGNSPAAGPADTIVSWWPGQAAPTTIANLAGTGQGAGRVLDRRLSRRRAPLGRLVRRQDLPRDARRRDGRRRRGAGRRRAQGLRERRLRARRHRRRRQPPAGRQLRLERDRARCRSRSS